MVLVGSCLAWTCVLAVLLVQNMLACLLVHTIARVIVQLLLVHLHHVHPMLLRIKARLLVYNTSSTLILAHY